MRLLFLLLMSAQLFAGFSELKIGQHLKQFSGLQFEGHCDRPQVEYFFKLLGRNPDIKLVAEIGFNAGHSSEVFLSARDDSSSPLQRATQRR